jgi:hypothetical protein
MAITVYASWLVASTHRRRRYLGFSAFLMSTVLWIVWGLHAKAWALIALQLFLVITNIRGLTKCHRET